MTKQDDAKKAAAEAALDHVRDGMRMGLGTGSTMEFVLLGLARRGLKVSGIATSAHTETRARELGIGLLDPNEVLRLDLAIDGADEVLPGPLHLIKGLGGAALREKIVAAAAERFIVVADDTKLVTQLGTHAPVPVEVAPLLHKTTAAKLQSLGCTPAIRGGATPFISDNGNLIYDCRFPGIANPPALAAALEAIPGVLAHGLFLSMAQQAVIAGADGHISVLDRA
jgi:ribose 5-phosphate isomerase A